MTPFNFERTSVSSFSSTFVLVTVADERLGDAIMSLLLARLCSRELDGDRPGHLLLTSPVLLGVVWGVFCSSCFDFDPLVTDELETARRVDSTRCWASMFSTLSRTNEPL
jgi:hypothetical protein